MGIFWQKQKQQLHLHFCKQFLDFKSMNLTWEKGKFLEDVSNFSRQWNEIFLKKGCKKSGENVENLPWN